MIIIKAYTLRGTSSIPTWRTFDIGCNFYSTAFYSFCGRQFM